MVVKRILALDPATSTGYCLALLDSENATMTIYEYGFLEVDTTSSYEGDHCIDLMGKLDAILKRRDQPVDEVCVEDYFFSSRYCSGSKMNVALRTAIYIECCRQKIPYLVIPVSGWKAYVAGRSQPTREQVRQWGKSAANKLFIQDALFHRWGIRFPNHCTSEKSGKPIRFRFDIVDAVGQMIYFSHCRQIPARGVHCDVPLLPDVKFTRSSKKDYNYSEEIPGGKLVPEKSRKPPKKKARLGCGDVLMNVE